VAYFYFDFENTAVIVSDKRGCIGLQELQASMAHTTASGGEGEVAGDWRSLHQIPAFPDNTKSTLN
jgi:hypothetical protein